MKKKLFLLLPAFFLALSLGACNGKKQEEQKSGDEDSSSQVTPSGDQSGSDSQSGDQGGSGSGGQSGDQGGQSGDQGGQSGDQGGSDDQGGDQGGQTAEIIFFRDAGWWNKDAASTYYAFDNGTPDQMDYLYYVEAGHYNYWKVELEEEATSITFYRYGLNDQNEYVSWGAATVAVNLADRGENNMYDISATTETWLGDDDNRVTGVWGVYVNEQDQGGEGGDATTYSLSITLNLETAPTNAVSFLYDVNGSIDNEWINQTADWNEMQKDGENASYTYTLSDLSEGDVVRFQFATWLEGYQNFYLSGSDDWKPASYTMGAANASLVCTASAFPTSTSATVVFTVA